LELTKTKTYVEKKKNHGSMAYFCLDCNGKYVILLNLFLKKKVKTPWTLYLLIAND
jgi:hypothetical protein